MDYIISIIPQMLLGTVDTLRLFFITIVGIIVYESCNLQRQGKS